MTMIMRWKRQLRRRLPVTRLAMTPMAAGRDAGLCISGGSSGARPLLCPSFNQPRVSIGHLGRSAARSASLFGRLSVVWRVWSGIRLAVAMPGLPWLVWHCSDSNRRLTQPKQPIEPPEDAP